MKLAMDITANRHRAVLQKGQTLSPRWEHTTYHRLYVGFKLQNFSRLHRGEDVSEPVKEGRDVCDWREARRGSSLVHHTSLVPAI